MSSIPTNDLTIFKGQHKNFVISVMNDNGLKNISLDTLEFKVFEYPDQEVTILKSTTDVAEIEKSDTTEITVKFLPVDTATLAAKRYYFQLWNTDGVTSAVIPALVGYFWILLAAPSISNEIRLVLDEAGEQGVKQIHNEVVSPTTVNLLYASHRRIKSVQGVYDLSDVNHAGTNYFTGGGFNATSGEVSLGANLPNAVSDVFLDYAWESGIDDSAISAHLEASRIWTKAFSGIEIAYGGSSDDLKMEAEYLARALTVVLCILTINGANVAQMGYNFRIHEFEIQSKLWGEGMIAQALFDQYNRELQRWIIVVGQEIDYEWANRAYKYNLGEQIGYTSSGAEGAER